MTSYRCQYCNSPLCRPYGRCQDCWVQNIKEPVHPAGKWIVGGLFVLVLAASVLTGCGSEKYGEGYVDGAIDATRHQQLDQAYEDGFEDGLEECAVRMAAQ